VDPVYYGQISLFPALSDFDRFYFVFQNLVDLVSVMIGLGRFLFFMVMLNLKTNVYITTICLNWLQ